MYAEKQSQRFASVQSFKIVVGPSSSNNNKKVIIIIIIIITNNRPYDNYKAS